MYSDFEILKAFLLILRQSGFGKNGLPYNIPVRGQLTPINSCFDVLRKFLPEEFKDKSNKEILKYLRKDPRSAERLVATHFRLEEAQELMQALEEEPVATAEVSGQPNSQAALPATPTATPSPGMDLPAAPSISTPNIRFRQQIRQQTPQPQVESQKLFIANSSGAVVGEKEITPTSVRSVSQGPSEIVLTDRNDKEIGKLSANPTAKISDSELHIDKNGNITETPTHGPSAPTQTPQPRLIITDRHGNIAPEPLKRPETAKLFTQDKNNIIREHTVKSPSRFSGLKSRFSSFASPLMNKVAGSAGPTIKKGLGGIGRGIMGVGRNGLEAAAPALGRTFNKGLDGLDKLTNPRRPNFRKRPKLSKLSKLSTGRKVALALLLFFIVFVGILVMPPSSGTIPIGEAAPISNPNSSNNWGLDYTLPLKNSSVQPLDIKSQITAAFPGAKLEYWDKIVQSSLTNGFNPALALALWIEETGASQTTLAKNGGSEIPVNGAFTRGHLGCAPTEDQTIDESLSCLFKFSAANNFTDGQFADFMAKYSGGPTSAPFSNNPNFPRNIKDWYSRLVPSGTGAIVAIAPTPTTSPIPQQPFVTSCPIPGGKITCGSSSGAPGIPACHCTASYSPSCPTGSRRGKAIDITGPTGSKDGDPVYLPLIKGRALKWYFRGDYNDDEGATLRVFQSESTTDGVWTIHFVHSKRKTDLLKTGGDFTAIPIFSNGQEITDLTQPVAYIDKSSGIGEIGTHTHVSIGLIGDNWYDGNLQYTNQGWKYADAEMNMCI